MQEIDNGRSKRQFRSCGGNKGGPLLRQKRAWRTRAWTSRPRSAVKSPCTAPAESIITPSYDILAMSGFESYLLGCASQTLE